MKQFNPHAIRTQRLRNKPHWTAFVTWKGIDIQEYGETERNAVLFLLEKHATFLEIVNVENEMKRIGFY